jgi:glucose-1-phosphate thymidylyltransferase
VKALLLGAGYAVRLYPLTRDRPKPLLKIGGIPIIQRIMDKLVILDELEGIYVVSNHRFVDHYHGWLREYKAQADPRISIRVVDDLSTSIDDKLGAIGDMQFVIENMQIDDDLLVIAGDNLFEFSLGDFISFGLKRGTSVALKDLGDKGLKILTQYGLVELDRQQRVIDFEEKPPLPRSSLVAIGIYFFRAKDLPSIKEYLDLGLNPDAPGHYIQWLSKRVDLYGYLIEGNWFDIGDIDSYNRANELYLTKG